MLALLCHEYGPDKGLKVDNIGTLVLQVGTVLISVKSAVIKSPDLLCVEGKYQIEPYLPFVAGGEGAGIVAELGYV